MGDIGVELAKVEHWCGALVWSSEGCRNDWMCPTAKMTSSCFGLVDSPPPSHLVCLLQQLQSLVPPPKTVQYAAEVVPHELSVNVHLP